MGDVDNTPFKNVGVLPGETIMQALERYARQRNIIAPVTFASGRLRLATSPASMGSRPLVKTIGMVEVNVSATNARIVSPNRDDDTNFARDRPPTAAAGPFDCPRSSVRS